MKKHLKNNEIRNAPLDLVLEDAVEEKDRKEILYLARLIRNLEQ